MGKKSLFYEKRWLIRSVLAAFLLMCLLIGAVCFQYYDKLQDTMREESGQYLQEISKLISDNASRTIKDNFAVLGTISTVLKNAQVTSYEEIQPIVYEQQEYWKYQNIFLVDGVGNAYDAHGKKILLKADTYLQEVIVNKTQSMSSSQVIDGVECVIFAIPIENMVVDNIEMIALAVSYDASTFDQILAMTAFNGRGYAHMIRKDGTMVVRSSSQYASQTGYNLLNTLASVEMDDQYSLAQLKRDMGDGKSGIMSFNHNGVREYMSYTPLATEEWYLMTFVPFSVVSAKSQLLLKITLLLCSFITIAFALLLAFLSLSFYKHQQKLEKIAYVDPITGGNTIQRFYELSGAFLKNSDKPQYAIIYSNVEKFKVLNEQFGRNACDGMLRDVEQGIAQTLDSDECIGRHFADNFCILVKYTDEKTLLKRLDQWYHNATSMAAKRDSVWLSPIIEFGVFVINNDTMPLNYMIDRAKLALGETTRELHGKLRYAIYDDEIRRQLFREKMLEDMMDNALLNGEFEVYLQPKYHIDTEAVGGAEALVRWNSASEGMIYPDAFIPLFEKNGFIIQLDLWVFEEVCRSIRKWLDAGLEPMKISVNCSRVNLNNAAFLQRYLDTCQRYNVPPAYIEIELTENVVFENVTYLTEVINQIQSAGFGCSMDDFGSGYSSLNLIQDIPVDTIKLDKVFFRSNKKDNARTESVVNSILSMARALDITTVAEGVEERVQVDMLKRLRCDYAQGYYFAKPMPISAFEKLVFGKDFNEEKENEEKEED